MRAVIQRVKSASVEVEGEVISQISGGLLIFIGFGKCSEYSKMQKMVDKIANLRIFEDSDGKMNLSLLDLNLPILLVSQFTLYADCKKGRRPSFTDAEMPERANEKYLEMSAMFSKLNIKCMLGKFQADMKVALVNDGPVTIVLDQSDIL